MVVEKLALRRGIRHCRCCAPRRFSVQPLRQAHAVVHAAGNDEAELGPSTSATWSAELELENARARRHRWQQALQQQWQPGGQPQWAQIKLHQRAKRLQAQSRPEAALAILHKGLKRFPHDTHFISLAASLESKLGNAQGAQRLLDNALQQQPENAALLLTAAMVHTRSGQPEAARRYFAAAHEADPSSAAVLQAWAMLDAAAGDLEAARQRFAAALQLDPSMSHVRCAWARAEAAAGNVQQARELFQAGVAASPGHVPLLHSWAQLEVRQGRTDEARQLLQRALQTSPSHAPSWLSLGKVHWMMGEFKEARLVWAEGSARTRSSPQLLTAWARHELRAGGRLARRHARELLAAALAADPHHLPALQAAASLEDRSVAGASRAEELYAAALQPQSTQTAAAVAAAVAAASAWAAAQATGRTQGVSLLSTQDVKRTGEGGRAQAAWHLSSRWQEEDSDNDDEARAAVASEEELPGLAAASQATGPVWEQGSFRAQVSQGDSLQDSERPRGTGNSSSVSTGAGTAVLQPLTGQAHGPYLRLLHARAQQLLRRGDRSGSQQVLGRMEALDMSHPLLCHARGVMAVQEGRLQDALSWFRRGLARKELSGRPAEGVLLNYEGLADVLAFQGDVAAARATFEAGLAACERPTLRFLRQYALMEKRCGSFDAAAQLYLQATQTEPQDPKTWLQWGVMERRRRHFEAAEECFRRGVTVAPRHPHLWYAYATMQCRLGNVDSARRLFRKATRMCPRSAPLWMEWALMEAALGSGSRARQLFAQGAQVPDAYQHPPLYEAWARMEAEAGNASRAAELMQQAAERGAQKQTPGWQLRQAPAAAELSTAVITAPGEVARPPATMSALARPVR